jgi:translation elongation factor P/translation initiation factor 5A
MTDNRPNSVTSLRAFTFMNNNKGKNSKEKVKAKNIVTGMIHPTTTPVSPITSPKHDISVKKYCKTAQTNISQKRQSILYKKKEVVQDRENSFSRDSGKGHIFTNSNTSFEVTKSCIL